MSQSNALQKSNDKPGTGALLMFAATILAGYALSGVGAYWLSMAIRV